MPYASPNWRLAITGFIALALAMGVGRFAFTPFLPMMQADALVTVTEAGLIATVHFLGYLMGALSAVRLSLPPRLTLLFSLPAITVSTWAMGATDDLYVWLILRWICGVASAWTLVTVSNYFIRALTAAGDETLQGIVFSGVGAGIATVGLLCLAFMVDGTASSLGWQITGIATLVITVALCFRVGRDVTTAHEAAARASESRSPIMWRQVIAYGMTGMGYIVPATYLPVMAQSIVDDPVVFGWSWPIFGLAAAVSTLVAAQFRRRYSDRQIWAVSQIIMAAGVLAPAFISNIAVIIASGVCVGGTFMIITMAGMKEAHRLATGGDTARHIAALTAAFAAGQMIGPIFASTLYDLSGGFSVSLALTGIGLLLTAGLLRAEGRSSGTSSAPGTAID